MSNRYAESFWKKVDIKGSNDCWNWKASIRGKRGGEYGAAYIGYITSAHRASWIISFGEIPYGKLVLHDCDNKLCVNPSHLYLGTYGDNMRDRCARNSISAESFGFGAAKLHDGEIWLIRRLNIENPPQTRKKFPATLVAKMFNVCSGTIGRIWKSEKILCREGYYV